MSIPNSISYRNVKPIGIPSRIRKTTFYPHNVYGGNIKPNDVVKFHVKAPTFWDPYNCFVKLRVEFDEADKNCTQQIDSSAQSFISEMIISAGNQEIERITEYDALAAMLMDISHDNQSRMKKQHEGLSSETLSTNNFNTITTADNTAMLTTAGYFCATHGFKPTVNMKTVNRVTKATGEAATTENHNFGALANPVNILKQATTCADVDLHIQTADNAMVSGRRKAFPGVFNPTALYPYNDVDLKNADKYDSTVTFDYAGKKDIHLDDWWDNSTALKQEIAMHSLQPPTVGNVNVFSSEFSAGCFEDCFSNSQNYVSFEQGKITQPIVKPKNSVEYIIPLLSGVLGILMPRESYKLFPAFAVDNLQIEFRVNPYAVFTSGYLPATYVSTDAKSNHTAYQKLVNQQQRKFRISEFELIVDLVQFDETITDLMRAQLVGDGIILSTHSFSQGPPYNIASYNHIGGVHTINMGFESLKTIYLMFMSNDYKEYSFCRKNYRLSRNVTSLQAKVGLEYYPEKALEGHGGNAYIVGASQKNNWVYIYELWRTFSHMNDIFQHTIINRYNFAIDERPYDVTNLEPYVDPLRVNAEKNIDTAMGFPLIHENRVVGRAIYVLNFASSANDSGTSINGINTIQNRPFDIIIQNDRSGGPAPTKDRSCTMLTFCHYDMILQITMTGVRVLGRA